MREGAEALAGRAAQPQRDRAGREARAAARGARSRPRGTCRRRGRCCRSRRELDGSPSLDRARGRREQRAVDARVGRVLAARRRRARARRALAALRRGEQRGRGRAAGRRAGAAGRCGRCASSSERSPSDARISRSSSATYRKYVTICSGVPANGAQLGICVAMPTGQVFRWQTRIMMQPAATSGAVEKPNSSAPSSAATSTSRPVRSPPSTCRRTRSRRPFATSTCCVSAMPSSHGRPACLIEEAGEAPVPPSWPAITMWSAFAFATPAATVPTPASATSLTLIDALGLTVRRS